MTSAVMAKGAAHLHVLDEPTVGLHMTMLPLV